MIEPLPSWDSEATRMTFHEGEAEQWYAGRKIQKCRQDMQRLQRAIADCGPGAIIEIGTRYGGSAGFLSDVSNRAFVVSIDLDNKLGWVGRNHDTYRRNIRYVDGPSTDVELFRMVASWIEGKETMVVLDSDHHAPHVLSEILTWGKLVSPGQCLVVEDACFDFWEGDDSRRGGKNIPEVGGPLRAIRLWDPKPDKWERAVQYEDASPVSHSPCGWWLRK